MKISTRGRYGIRLMLALALNYNNGTIPLKTIAKDQGISEKYLEQIINPLTKSGLVKSFRGAQGGYMLTNPPEATTVGEILRVLEGSLSPVDCVDHPNCANSDHCASGVRRKRTAPTLPPLPSSSVRPWTTPTAPA